MHDSSLALRRSFCVFHFVLATVLFVQSAMVAAAAADVHIRALGTVEALAAILFLFPATLRIGACTLLATFAVAAAVHLRAGQWPGVLLVYAAGTVFVWLHGSAFGTVHRPSSSS